MGNKTILAVLVLLVAGYFFAYVAVRRTNTAVTERDGCPMDGCTIVYFKPGTFSLIYTPMIALDERINHVEFEFTGWKS